MMITIIPTGFALLIGGMIASSSLLAGDMTHQHDHQMKSMADQPMSHQPMSDTAMPSMPVANTVTAKGVVKHIDAAARKVKVMHQPIPAWNMDAMQMTFHLAPQVDISGLKNGETIHFKLTNPSVGNYHIIELMPH
ncbi:MAG: copper-binding protein [Halopseudomonas sp.]